MNRKYTEEMREQTVVYYLESGKSQQVIANEIGIGINTLTRWVNRYKEEHGIPDRTRKQLWNELKDYIVDENKYSMGIKAYDGFDIYDI